MKSTRLEAYSDAVIAIVITIMVLELHVPDGSTLQALGEVLPTFLAYVLSFIFLSIYWNNHHHLLQATEQVNGGILWANILLLFWLSLVPFATAWASRNPGAACPAALYGTNLLMAAVAYTILQSRIVAMQGKDSALAAALGNNFKGILSVVLHFVGIAAAFWLPVVSYTTYAAIALIWLVPDSRIERNLYPRNLEEQ